VERVDAEFGRFDAARVPSIRARLHSRRCAGFVGFAFWKPSMLRRKVIADCPHTAGAEGVALVTFAPSRRFSFSLNDGWKKLM
jgi:hypothetical protein